MVTWLLEALRRNDPWSNRDFDPEEAVLKGAAIQADILSNGDDGMITLLDITPVSLGLETSQGYMHKTIRRHTPIPTRKAQNLTTAYDNQESMLIRVFEGDRMMAKDNVLVGELELTGIPPAPRHVPIVEVTFELDVSTRAALLLAPGGKQQFEESSPVDKASLDRYVGLVERVTAREDVVDAPYHADDFDVKK
ncbi:glucose-regulated protein [Diaporthe helianthi]|uniref:Glucose-regulated protein n=1 Tax=Diaporthe helianthi TaxID=158607 RepID=A0A2P5HNN8_DIAHE|nr:glucose-regulated protein [Diaporthe helianthi]